MPGSVSEFGERFGSLVSPGEPGYSRWMRRERCSIIHYVYDVPSMVVTLFTRAAYFDLHLPNLFEYTPYSFHYPGFL